MDIFLELPDKVYNEIYNHLIRKNQLVEEAAFIFAIVEEDKNNFIFKYRDRQLLNPQDFRIQEDYHIELKDNVRGEVIKKAHDLNSTIIEAHSHLDAEMAMFSRSDFIGFSEFVPHVMWRLKGKPYAALVFTFNGFDGLIWKKDNKKPQQLDYIQLNNKKLNSSKQTLNHSRIHDEN